jgi:type IV pilus assembly protein PilN
MLVEINLLPKKEPKNVTFLVIIFSALLILLVAGSVFLWQGSRFDNELASIEKDISTTKQLIKAEEAKQISNQASSSYAELGSAVQWANEEPLKSVPIITHIVALLPQRGFIKTITYAEAGAVSLTVQFDTSRDSAYFLKRLLDSEWVSEANLTSLTIDESEETDADTEIIPRYKGQFEINLNRNFINQEERLKNLENNQTGGDNS